MEARKHREATAAMLYVRDGGTGREGGGGKGTDSEDILTELTQLCDRLDEGMQK